MRFIPPWEAMQQAAPWLVGRYFLYSPQRVCELLRVQGLEPYYPEITKMYRPTHRRRARRVSLPAYPGWLFVRGPIERESYMLTPAWRYYRPLPDTTFADSEIADIRDSLPSVPEGEPVSRAPVFVAGQRVRITAGIAEGHTLVVDRAGPTVVIGTVEGATIPLQVSPFLCEPLEV